ncbi:MAG TPA: SMC-Scp complex subunit ScpB [Nitrospiraceae bacterium]|nr:SMC-Scp complex subunit ScpB [Nitrospiraceae bacterium]
MKQSSTAQATAGLSKGREGSMAEAAAAEVESPCEADLNGAGESAHDNGIAAPAETSSIAEMRELSGILEALLFMAADPLPMNRIVTLVGAVSKQHVQEALMRLKDEYAREGRGLDLVEIAGGYRLVTKPDYAPWIKRLEKIKAPAKLSRSALESLAIIAYKQPIVRAEIEQIRGVETSGVLRTLLERKLVRIVGRKEEPGRPILYGTTKFFLEHFGLRDLSQLPPLRELKELGESEQVLLPMEEGQSLEEDRPFSEIQDIEGETDDAELVTAEADQSESLLESVQRN